MEGNGGGGWYLVRWGLQTWEQAKEGGVGLVMAGGARCPFIVAERGTPGRGRGKWPTVMALMPLKAGRLNEGIKGGIDSGGV
jgi:hypothetical protein